MTISNFTTKFFNGETTVASYLNSIRKYKVPTAEEEKVLFERIQNGDEDARQEIILRNQRFVFSIAKIYAKDEHEVLDYVNEGNIGLYEAIDKYIEKKLETTNGEPNVKFISVAVNYIRREMNYYLTTTNYLVRRSNNMKLSKKIEEIKAEYLAENECLPSPFVIMEKMQEKYGIEIHNPKDVCDLNMSYIDDEVSEDFTEGESVEFTDKTASLNAYETTAENEYVNSVLMDALSVLPDPRYIDIIKMLYGIGYDRAYSLDEVGKKYGLDGNDTNKLQELILEYLRNNAVLREAI